MLSFLWVNNILLCRCGSASLSIHLKAGFLGRLCFIVEMRVFEMDKSGRVPSAESSTQGRVDVQSSPCPHGLECGAAGT